jgi:hypothetical protein
MLFAVSGSPHRLARFSLPWFSDDQILSLDACCNSLHQYRIFQY